MQIEEELARLDSGKDTILTIGMFDGVHLGHRFLLSALVDEARSKNMMCGAVTFKQHPRDLFRPKSKLSFLTTLPEREKLIKEVGVDIVAVLPFNHKMADLTARQFLGLLQKYLHMKGLVIGPDTTVGKDCEADTNAIAAIGKEMGFYVKIASPQLIEGEKVSSTAIRNAIAAGDMKKTTRLLGHPLSLQGAVTYGDQRGTDLGFPTANIEVDKRQALPPDGVFATWAYVDGQPFQSMTNIGKRPTFGEFEDRTIEVFILDYTGNIYGKSLKIELIEYLRGESKFESADDLKKQISDDVKQGREILSSVGNK